MQLKPLTSKRLLLIAILVSVLALAVGILTVMDAPALIVGGAATYALTSAAVTFGILAVRLRTVPTFKPAAKGDKGT